ncbi:MAG: hypothetical protein WCY09_05515 [Candidatus Omnitrophota bacterium]
MAKRCCGVTLIELTMVIVLMSLVFLGFFSIVVFSGEQVKSAINRSKVQNEISYALEFMSKYVQQGIGNSANPSIKAYATGFQVGVDFNPIQTPGIFSDDSSIIFSLSGNQLSATCTNSVTGSGCPFTNETLSSRIAGSLVTGTIMPESPTEGFYVRITDQGMAVDIGLSGRYKPAVAAGQDNPQISMRTRSVSLNSSAH